MNLNFVRNICISIYKLSINMHNTQFGLISLSSSSSHIWLRRLCSSRMQNFSPFLFRFSKYLLNTYSVKYYLKSFYLCLCNFLKLSGFQKWFLIFRVLASYVIKHSTVFPTS